MQVHEIMTHNPISVDVSATVRQAAERLFDLDVRHLPVLENNELIGMLSDRDLKGYRWSYAQLLDDATNDAELPDTLVAELMTGSVLSVSPDSDIKEVIDLIKDHKVGAVAVVGPENNLVGIVSYVDVLTAAYDRL